MTGPAWWAVLIPFAITRAGLAIVAVVAWNATPNVSPCDPCSLSQNPLLDALSRWDGAWYLSIARDGYAYQPGALSNVTFSPLYPVLMRFGAMLLPGGGDDAFLLAGVIVANLALVAALAMLLVLVTEEHGATVATRAVMYVLVFPTSFFLSAVYPESLFLALAIAAVLQARRRRWLLSGALAALAALTRPFGVLLVLPLAVEFVAAHRSGQRPSKAGLVGLALPPLAFIGWQAYLYRLTGDPLLSLSAQAAYGRRPAPPWQAFVDLFDPSKYDSPWLVAVMFVGMAVLVGMSWRTVRPSLALYATSLLVATSSTGTLASFMRYALALFPAFIVLGIAGSRTAVHLAYIAIATLLSVLLTAMFAQAYWVG